MPVLYVRGIAGGERERAGQGDAGPLVDRLVGAARDGQGGGGRQRGHGAGPVDDRILGLGLYRVVGRAGHDRIVARAGVHRVAGGGVAPVAKVYMKSS